MIGSGMGIERKRGPHVDNPVAFGRRTARLPALGGSLGGSARLMTRRRSRPTSRPDRSARLHGAARYARPETDQTAQPGQSPTGNMTRDRKRQIPTVPDSVRKGLVPDPMGLVRNGAEAPPTVGLVVRVVPLEPFDTAVALEG